jgi:hypothetical protein
MQKITAHDSGNLEMHSECFFTTGWPLFITITDSGLTGSSQMPGMEKCRNAEISTTVQEGEGESAVLFIYHSISAAPHNKEGT